MSAHESLRKAVTDSKLATKDTARPDAVAYQHDRGKLTARERIDRICDDGSFGLIHRFGHFAHKIANSTVPVLTIKESR